MTRLVLAGAALVAFPLAAQPVLKCIDAAGNVTYQNAPCDKGQAARPVEMPKAENRDDTSAWEAAAHEGKVVAGMPKRWVLRSRGAPAEIRAGGPREAASEVWRYAGADGVPGLVGFQGEQVAWVREDGRPTASAPVLPPLVPAATPPGAGATRGPQNRRFVIAGRYCEHVFAEIGTADREEPLAATGAAPAGRRYTYEPAPGDAAMRTVFNCVDGRVADVERTLVR
ncbi:MAG: DUF4124 domain-containing protein [Burkholderiales bacterium]|nr:DUF4124 domain-containing protein [Burkholderiales bacterium]